MFKWKVSGLGGKKEKSPKTTRLNNDTSINEDKNNKVKEGNNNNNKKDKTRSQEDATSSPRTRGFRLFQSGGQGPTQDTGTGTLRREDPATLSRVGQRLACVPQPMPNGPQMGFKSSAENLLEETKMPPPLPPLKPEWRTHMRTAQQLNNGENEEQVEEAIPNDSLYGVGGGGAPWRDTRPPPPQAVRPKPNLSDMSHWSSHGYLAKGGEEGPASPPQGNGYVVLKRQGDGMVTMRSPANNSNSQQPSSLPPITNENSGPGAENKYFSVRGMRDMINKVGDGSEDVGQTQQSQKYFSVDAKFLHQHADMKNKLRENLRASQAKEMPQQQDLGGGGGLNGLYHAPAPPPSLPPYQRPPPPAHLRSQQQEPKPPAVNNQNNLETTKAMSGSVSWLEWTQQLQAYIAWVNSQLRKRADLKPVQDLRSDLQSGEVLAQLIEIISGEQIAGIVYQPESLQGMRENLERVLQFMASKKIRMHSITSKEVLEGNLKAVMRLILALAAHYKPQSVKHHDVSYEQMPEVKSAAGSSKPEAGNTTNGEPVPPAPVVPVVPPPVKRSPSLNESHYSPATLRVTEPGEKRVERRSRSDLPKSTVETQTQVGAPTVTSPPTRGLSREGSFTRTGSGRKLPQIPDRVRSNTLPSRKNDEEKENGEKEDLEDVADDSKKELRKPKAMEFWESMENIERNDFRYNTIHRMSMGRRLLPKPPGEAASHGRSASVDRSDSSNEAEKLSLNSSFSGPTSLPVGGEVSESEARLSPRLVNIASTLTHKIPADGASLQSQASGNSLPLDCRGEVEGSSTNNSPPTSVIGQPGVVEGEGNVWELGQEKRNPAYEWVRGTWDQKEESRARRKWGLPSPVTCPPGEENLKGEKQVPYEVLLEDLSQAKRQLLELHNLLLQNLPGNLSSDLNNLKTNLGINLGANLPNRLLPSETTGALLIDLRRAKQECLSLEGSKAGLQSRLAEQEANISQLKANLLRTTLAKQSLEGEKKELLRRLEEEKGDLQAREMMDNEAHRNSISSVHYTEELAVARDAIANLRVSFSEADPNQHILDTLEQCVSVIVEKLGEQSKPGSRAATAETNTAPSPTTTKVVYFTPRSVTPFMSSLPRAVGQVTLRDFKQLFDRPGFFRYHFKTMDKEFGMVKEEIADDDQLLPGVEGKIVVWVEEE